MRLGAILLLGIVIAGCGDSTSTGRDGGRDGAPDDAPTVTDAAPPDAARVCQDDLPSPITIDPAVTPEITILNDPGSPAGIFDPSLVYPSGAPSGALAYSSVTSTASIRTRIALSSDRGNSWTYVADANAPATVMVDSTDTAACPSGTCTGQLINEVSSLVIDPLDADAQRRWKLFTHRYLVLPPAVLRYDYGHIALATAPAPEGPWSAPQNLIGWPSTSSISSAGAATLTTGINLGGCVALTEPGALVRQGTIDLVVGCVSVAGGVSIRLELLRSTDHARSFTRVRTLLSGADVPCLGENTTRVNAGELFVAGGQQYLIATPDVEGAGYRGCAVMPIDDPVSGAVRRSALGGPVVLRTFVASRFIGACSYAEGPLHGYLIPIAFLGDPRTFRMYRSGRSAP